MHIHAPRILSCPLLLALAIPAVAQGDKLYSVNSLDGFLREVDPLTATTVFSTQITTTNIRNAAWCNGLARDPVSGALYVLVREVGFNPRNLATLDPVTGLATIIGPMADNFAGLAFRADGTLFGVTGDGAITPETLWTINTANAVATQVVALGNGTEGETIGFAPDGFLYHASGFGVPNVDEVFERINTANNTITSVPLAGHDYDEMLSLTTWVGGNLLGADINDSLIVITTAGQSTQIGTLDHSFVKGLAFLPSPNSQAFFRPYGNGCTDSSATIPLFVGSGTPGLGQAISFHLMLAPASSLGVLALGTGTGVIPNFPSAACQVQISPVGPGASTFFTSATGDFTINATVPANLLPFDFYFQIGILDVSVFVVSNPLQTHVR